MPNAGDFAADIEEAEAYELLKAEDIDGDPPPFRPIGPGDVFCDVPLEHLATPFRGPVIVVGHPCSIRRGLEIQDDLPVAPLVEPGIPSIQHSLAERVLPVKKLLPPGSDKNRVIQLTLATTIPSAALDPAVRCASLNRAGVVALQQRLVGNQTRIKVPAGVIAAHCRGPLAELELWTDWREACVDAGEDAESKDTAFNEFMEAESGFEALSWREALGVHEHAQARATAAMEALLQIPANSGRIPSASR
jgi:hypothetical protein